MAAMAFPDHVVVVGGTGQHGRGKTTFFRELGGVADVNPDIAIVECSEPIVPLAELYRKFLLKYFFEDGLDLTTRSIIEHILGDNQAYVWLNQASGGQLPDIPASAFTDVGHLDSDKLSTVEREILRSATKVLRNEEDYLKPVTIENKSTGPIRPLLTAINLLVSELACHWLRQNGYPDVKNLWPFLAMRRAEQIHRDHPDYKLIVINGLRMEGDCDAIRALGGLILERDYTAGDIEESHSELATEQRQVRADFVVLGDAGLEGSPSQLREVAEHVWWLLWEHILKASTDGTTRVLHTEDLINCDGTHDSMCLAA